jgi:molybdopterin-guanine dinucleotide biosynthesis protein A
MNYSQAYDADRRTAIDKVQQDVNEDVAKGNHPFVKVRALTQLRPKSQYSTLFYRDTVPTWNGQRLQPIEDADTQALEAAMPIWDCGIDQLNDGFYISANIERHVIGGKWLIELFMNVNTQEDYETWSILSKLGGIPDLNQQ